MKYLSSLLTLLLITTIFSCSSGGGAEGDAETDSTAVANAVEEDYSNMSEADLSDYGIMATIMTPDDGKLEIEETSWGSVTLKAGQKFGLEIVPFGLTLEEMKAEMDQGGVYKVEIIEEDPAYILYKRSIPDSEVSDEYHFFMNKEINGEIYEIKSMADMELKEGAARKNLKAAKSFKAKPSA